MEINHLLTAVHCISINHVSLLCLLLISHLIVFLYFFPNLRNEDAKAAATNGEQQIKFLGRFMSVPPDDNILQINLNDLENDEIRQEPRILFISIMKELIDDYEFRFALPFMYNSRMPSIDCQAFRENQTFIQSPLTTVIELNVQTNEYLLFKFFHSDDDTEQIIVNASFARENTSSTLNFIIKQKIGDPNYRLYMHSCTKFWSLFETRILDVSGTDGNILEIIASVTYVLQAQTQGFWIQLIRHALEWLGFWFLIKYLSCPSASEEILMEELWLTALVGVCHWKLYAICSYFASGFLSSLAPFLLEQRILSQACYFMVVIGIFILVLIVICECGIRRNTIIFMFFAVIELSLIAKHGHALHCRIHYTDPAVITTIFIWLNNFHLGSMTLHYIDRVRESWPFSVKYGNIFLHILFIMYLCVRSFDLVTVILPIHFQWMEYYISEAITSLLFLIFIVIYALMIYALTKILKKEVIVYDNENDNAYDNEAETKPFSVFIKPMLVMSEKDQSRDLRRSVKILIPKKRKLINRTCESDKDVMQHKQLNNHPIIVKYV